MLSQSPNNVSSTKMCVCTEKEGTRMHKLWYSTIELTKKQTHQEPMSRGKEVIGEEKSIIKTL